MKQAHQANQDNGWWEPKPNPALLASKIIEEVGEAITALSKDKWAKILPYSAIQSPYFADRYRELVKGSFEEEIADIVIRCWDFVEGFNVNINKKKEYITSTCVRGTYWTNVDIANEEKAIALLSKIAYKSASFVHRALDCEDKASLMRHFASDAFADILPSCVGIANIYNIDLYHHTSLKVAYNATRSHRHGGKKF